MLFTREPKSSDLALCPGGTTPGPKSRSILHVADQVPSDMGVLQARVGLLLDRRRSRPLPRPRPFLNPNRRRAPLHHRCPRLLCRLRWHSPRESRFEIHVRSSGRPGSRILRIPDRGRAYPLRNAQPPPRNLHKGSVSEGFTLPRHRHDPLCDAVSRLGPSVDQLLRFFR